MCKQELYEWVINVTEKGEHQEVLGEVAPSELTKRLKTKRIVKWQE